MHTLFNKIKSNPSQVVGIVVAAVIFILVWQRFFTDSFNLPRGGQSRSTVVGVEEDGELVEREIMITDGTKHSIPLDEILSGGPPKDGIPSIDNPKFESLVKADEWLVGGEELGLALEFEGKERFYPYRILVQHEIVNDTINGKRVLITYCPLCFTGIVFLPVVDGESVEFGVSGKLWNSNLLMYDRKTDSLWSQISGEAVVGEKTGQTLKVIPSDVTKYSIWKKSKPNGQVLSRDTGQFRSYDSLPYGGDLTNIKPIFPFSNKDDRLDENAYIIGIVIESQAKAYQFDAVKRAGSLEEEFAGKTLIIEYVKQVDGVRVFEKKPDGSREQLRSIPSFWFSWAAVYPDTKLYK